MAKNTNGYTSWLRGNCSGFGAVKTHTQTRTAKYDRLIHLLEDKLIIAVVVSMLEHILFKISPEVAGPYKLHIDWMCGW